jgi:predicted nucleotidyltransferase
MSIRMIVDQAIPILGHNLKAESILLYGSYALNMHDEQSDFDLLVIEKKVSSADKRKRIYDSIPQAQILEVAQQRSQQNNGWDNSWSPINDKLLINNRKVEIGYNTAAWVNSVIEHLIDKHQITFKRFPFRPYTFLGLLEACKVLYDPYNFIGNTQSRIRPFPEPLKNKIMAEFMPILIEAHEELNDYTKRKIGILAYQFHLFRGIDALIQVLFVLNDIYDPAAKRIEPILLKLKMLPPHVDEFLFKTLPRFYERQEQISQFFEDAIQYIQDTKI